MEAVTQLASDVHFLVAPLRFLWRSLLWLIFLFFAPILYLTVPFVLIALEPHAYFPVLALVYMALGPFVCAFWMVVCCHLPTVRKAHREGRLREWRDDAGGYRSTIPKAFAFMCMGLVGSIFSEVVFCALFRVPSRSPWSAAMYFAAAPFATFAPVILLWIIRWMRSRKNQDFIGRMKNDRVLQQQLRAASLYARTLREREKQ